MSKSHLHALTLVEVLVVLAIIGVLAAIIVPAIQAAREVSRRARCASNLRQIAFGTHNYHESFAVFPINYLPERNPAPKWRDNSNSKYWSWLARTLPYVEQISLYKQLSVGENTLRQSEPYVGTQVHLFLCSSDDYSRRGPRVDGDNLGSPPLKVPLPIGQTNYKGVSGANWRWGDQRWNSVASTIDGSFNGLIHGDGMFYRTDYLAPRRLAMVTDGTSNVFMIGEDLPEENTHCSWPYANHSQGTCAIPPNARQPNGQRFERTDWHNLYSFRSHHPPGVQFAFADGAVRTVSNSIAIGTYRALATIQGGEICDLP